MKFYKYTITVYDTSPNSGNMIIDSINSGDPAASSDYDMEEIKEDELPLEMKEWANMIWRRLKKMSFR
jgi:hypothetical protein